MDEGKEGTTCHIAKHFPPSPLPPANEDEQQASIMLGLLCVSCQGLLLLTNRVRRGPEAVGSPSMQELYL